MRSLSAILALLLLLPGAASAKVRTVKSIDAVEPGRRVRIEGLISIRGSTPFTLLVLETGDGNEITLKPHTPEIEHELKNLDGLRVAVQGEVLPLLEAALPRLEVDAYDLLAPPGADGSITGVISTESGGCVLTTSEGKRYWIVGGVAPAMCEHAGARLWMVGKKAKQSGGKPPAGSTPFTPTGYGVIEN